MAILEDCCCQMGGVSQSLSPPPRSLLPPSLYTPSRQTRPGTAHVAQSALHTYQDPPSHTGEIPIIRAMIMMITCVINRASIR